MVSACLGKPLATILGHLKAFFPPAAACLAAQGRASSNSPVAQGTAMLSADLVLDEDEEGSGAHQHCCLAVSVTEPQLWQ